MCRFAIRGLILPVDETIREGIRANRMFEYVAPQAKTSKVGRGAAGQERAARAVPAPVGLLAIRCRGGACYAIRSFIRQR